MTIQETTEPSCKLVVIISGGFSLAYHEVIPHFEKELGVMVATLSGSSQGSNLKTIRSQLERGIEADVVILSREGLAQLLAADLVLEGSGVELARVLLGAAVRQGDIRRDVGTVAGLRATLLAARRVGIPESTSGIFVKEEVLPRLHISGEVRYRFFDRGAESTAALASGETDLAVGPMSELIGQQGIDIVGPLPAEVQLDQVFMAAIVSTSRQRAGAKALIDFLASERLAAAIERAGMQSIGMRG